MSSEFGKNVKVSVFGQSHSAGIGAVINGIPAGIKIDMDQVAAFMALRAPGKNKLSTTRKEADLPEVMSGILDGVTTGAPICAVIRNTDTRSKDYANIIDIPRPGHSDFSAYMRYGGNNDVRGGGHFSGRLTAPLCFAGAICMQILESKGIYVGAHIQSVGEIEDQRFDDIHPTVEGLTGPMWKSFPVIDDEAGAKMQEAILAASADLDSIGGTIECVIAGVEPGFGEHMADGVENRMAAAIFGIPAVKGIEFGSGFAGSRLRGSQNNDPFCIEDEKIRTITNNHGGILGGITSGMPIRFAVALKPTPSISRPQQSVSLSRMEPAVLEIKGRHDPCIVHRAVPVVAAVAAMTMLDIMYDDVKLL